MALLPSSPILINKDAYLAVVAAADQAASDPAKLSVLLDSIELIRNDADTQLLSENDLSVLSRIAVVGVIGNDQGYYRRLANRTPSARSLGQVDRGGHVYDLLVEDEEPIDPDHIRRLVRKGVIWRGSASTSTTGVVFEHYTLRKGSFAPNENLAEWSCVGGSEERFEGGWLTAGNGAIVGWVPFLKDAGFIVGCINAVLRLTQDISLWWREPPLGVIEAINRAGFAGLLKNLHQSVLPQERYDKPLPEEIERTAAQLKDGYVKLVADVAALRRPRG